MRRTRCFVTIAAAVLLAVSGARAMINPGFTPVHLVKRASVILWVDIKAGEAKDPYTATIRETLKGKAAEKTFRLDISKAGEDEAATALREQLAAGKPALFVACESGDRLFAGAKGRTFTDLTEARGLQSKSAAFAWGDFAGQGRLDLISFDGKGRTP